MREQIRQAFRDIGPTGIGAHGTSLARARLIEAQGLDPNQTKRNGPQYVYYAVQPPSCEENVRATLRALSGKSSTSDALKKVVIRSHIVANSPEYHTGNPGDGTQAIVLFRPLRTFDPNTYDILHSNPRVQYDNRHIPAANVIGTVVLEPTLAANVNTFLSMAKLLAEKGIVNMPTLRPRK